MELDNTHSRQHPYQLNQYMNKAMIYSFTEQMTPLRKEDCMNMRSSCATFYDGIDYTMEQVQHQAEGKDIDKSL